MKLVRVYRCPAKVELLAEFQIADTKTTSGKGAGLLSDDMLVVAAKMHLVGSFRTELNSFHYEISPVH